MTLSETLPGVNQGNLKDIYNYISRSINEDYVCVIKLKNDDELLILFDLITRLFAYTKESDSKDDDIKKYILSKIEHKSGYGFLVKLFRLANDCYKKYYNKIPKTVYKNLIEIIYDNRIFDSDEGSGYDTNLESCYVIAAELVGDNKLYLNDNPVNKWSLEQKRVYVHKKLKEKIDSIKTSDDLNKYFFNNYKKFSDEESYHVLKMPSMLIFFGGDIYTFNKEQQSAVLDNFSYFVKKMQQIIDSINSIEDLYKAYYLTQSVISDAKELYYTFDAPDFKETLKFKEKLKNTYKSLEESLNDKLKSLGPFLNSSYEKRINKIKKSK
ncbi:MAG: hypothetical protein WC307_00655 [Candidatus Nanoarchaeia archaeon]